MTHASGQGALAFFAVLPTVVTLAVLFASIVLLVWSLRESIIGYFAQRAERADLVRRRLHADKPPIFSVYGQPLLGLGAFLVLGLAGGWVVGILAGAMLYVALGKLPERALRRTAEAFEKQLPDALMDMANSTKAGLTLPQAVETVADDGPAPIALEFGQVLSDYRRGRTIEQAFDDARGRVQSRNFDLAIRAFRVGIERGGNVTEVFQQIAGSIREIWRLEEHVKTVTSEARSSARFMMVMPFAFFLLGFLMDPQGMQLMLTDPIGLTVLSVVVLIILVCRTAINRILNVDI